MPLTSLDRAIEAAMYVIAQARRQHLVRETLTLRQRARRLQREALHRCRDAARLQHREDRRL